ncbi:hypothetical protein K503DRAFT_801234 [Rhizopogon vinicolor AM-OR11-026]|uniref:Uncharacterized protein n=1 Tax=Rhizopogon vinicolor AM-OR11-026 TaxID=1314800 RepID=A0A1B7MXX7_9AGAM|nr:hypothetical protein K503DRAFT_801234 [Rhizopogon vinicolor AM-OR11-026]
MTHIAEFMVEEPFKDGFNGAPAFKFYKINGGDDLSKVDEAAKELQGAIKLRLENTIKEVTDNVSYDRWFNV